MNRRMILLAVAITASALTCSAKAAAWIKRCDPTEEHLVMPVGTGRPFTAEFGGLTWPYIWHEAQWYVDDVLTKSESLSGTAGDTTLNPGFETAGTVTIKVRARYDSFPWGVDVWTDYVTWTIEVYAHPPSASRVSPASPVTVSEGDSQAFTASGTDPLGALDIRRVEWYLDGVHQTTFEFDFFPIDPTVPREHTWSHTFETPGTYQVEAVFHDWYDPSATGEALWTVNVVGKRTLTVSSTAGGSVTAPGEGAFEYAQGTGVTLEATADSGYQFTHWSGEISSTSNPLHVTVDSDYNVTANFARYPTVSCVSPGGPMTACTGVPVTFTAAGTDPEDDLRLCAVYLNGAFQANAPFSGPASGSTATWTHTFSTPGTYTVTFTPFDLAGHEGSAAEWTVVVKAAAEQAGLNILVIALDAQGRAQGPLADAEVGLTGPAAAMGATSDGQGKFAFTGLEPGTYTVNVSRDGYYTQSRSVSLAGGETKDEMFRLTPESLDPAAFDFTSPGGKYFIEGLPGDLSFSVIVAWNGSPGLVRFNAAGTWHTATVTDLGEGKALASLTIPVPDTIPERGELEIEVSNGEGKSMTMNTGVYLYPSPSDVSAWLANVTDVLPWEVPGVANSFSFKMEQSLTLWDISSQSGKVSSEAVLGYELQLAYDPWAGTLSGLAGGFGMTNMKMDTSAVELLGNGRIDLIGNLAITFAGSEPPTVEPTWKLSFSGKAGVGAPVVNAISAVFPPAAGTIETLKRTPVVGDLVTSLKVRLYLIVGGALTGEYNPDGLPAECWFGTTSVSGSITLGLEGQVVVAFKKWGWKLEAGVYAGGTGTPEFQICPDWEFRGVTLRAYVGVFVSSWSYRFSKEVAMTVQLGGGGQQKVLALSALPGSDPDSGWQPIGDSCLRWGEMNLLASEGRSGKRFHALSIQGEIPQETRLVENVVSNASPVLLSGPSGRLILFCLHDPNKPWYAATDIGTLHQTDDQPWVLDRITDDQAAEFSPSVVTADSGMILAAWERVSGDISDTTEPEQIAPHMEIATASFDRNTATWSTPEELTSNEGPDCQPMAVAFGTTRGILWIAGQENDTGGSADSGDRLMFAKWSGNGWAPPQTLWSAQKSIVNCAFVADGLDEGHVVLAVDEDTDPNTSRDQELYLLSTSNGTWQPTIQLTRDTVEDSLPTLVAPYGMPTCVWSADNKLVYSELDAWNPRQVYSEYTLANEAPSLDAVTMPGGAAIAYTVQGPNGVDIVASFYDADLDSWALPRQLTNDEHAETALSLTCDAGELVIAYLKTQTLRTGMDVEIEGKIFHLENVPQPGRTDLYVLRHALANDLAMVSQSLVLDPANPAPGAAATICATIENRGDLPLQDVAAVFYDGDPSRGGVAIGDWQVIPGTLIAGDKQDVSVAWDVPQDQSPHEIFVVVDPCLAVEDRDRSNNVLSARTVLPDLTIETCWSTEVSNTSMAVTARVVNPGIILANAFDVSWRLGAADGEQIGTSTIPSLISGGAFEATFIWDTAGHLDSGQHVQVSAVADATGVVPEFDETNNVSSLAVFHPPASEP